MNKNNCHDQDSIPETDIAPEIDQFMYSAKRK